MPHSSKWSVHVMLVLALTLLANCSSLHVGQPAGKAEGAQGSAGGTQAYLPVISNDYVFGGDWPQLGHDAQRTNSSPAQISPPYCYTWKWYEVPIASRAQPVVANNRLFIGGMDGILYARNASTGAPLWAYTTGGPIRHAAGVLNNTVIVSSHDGFTYALDATTGTFKWKTSTGSSSTAPLIDSSRGWAYVASSNGRLTALNVANGSIVWVYDSGAPILTSPSLSVDGQIVFLGNEAIQAIAVRASDGVEIWRTTLQGQSLADRYPVVAADAVIYRSQPLYFFHLLLQEYGDDVMDRAGPVDPNWAADWAKVRPQIISHLTTNPSQQTFFVLNANTGTSRGVAPVLYTYGNNDTPNVPVVQNGSVYMTYRARHGIQTDSGTAHVSSRYDAEIGQLNLSTLDITGLRSATSLSGAPEFRMTSDEPAMLSMSGDILWVDSWERLGGINVKTGQLIHVGAVSNDWPECGGQCGAGTNMPFFPLLSGNPYPFPSPRVTEGYQRGGVVIAGKMLYWRVIEGGLAGISHRAGSACPTPQVWTNSPTVQSSNSGALADPISDATPARALSDYVTLDLTTPVINPPADLVARLRQEVSDLVSANNHLMPYYLERGFTQSFVWPYDTTNPCSPNPCLPVIVYGSHGNAYWHDPGELLYTLALTYPYLDDALRAQVKTYVAGEMNRYPPLQSLPYGDPNRDWLKQGVARESYAVPFRSSLNNWPPVDANMSALYALWLWSKNTGDWSYAQTHWAEATALFNARRGNMIFYADVAGAIGYARMAASLGHSSDASAGTQAAVSAMQAGLDFTTFRQRAEADYPDPRDQTTGWYAPVFYGLTPEVGLYLNEQLGGAPQGYLASKESGNGLRWWYLTRAGAHAEIGETSYIAPIAAWSHFLAHAYVMRDPQATLRTWLDRPWGRGDLYSIQKIVATLHGDAPVP